MKTVMAQRGSLRRQVLRPERPGDGGARRSGSGSILQGRIEHRALRGAEQLARTYAGLAVVPNVTGADLGAPLPPAAARGAGRRARRDRGRRDRRPPRERLRGRRADGLLRRPRADRRGRARRRLPAARSAASWCPTSSASGRRGASLEVYVPLRLPGGPRGRRRDRALPRLRPDGRRGPRADDARALPAARAAGWGCSTCCSSCSSTGSHAGCATRPSTTRSPACRTGPRCTSASGARARSVRLCGGLDGAAADRPRPVQGGQRHARATTTATGCCATSPSGCAARCGAGTRSPGSAATSSRSLLHELPDRGAAVELAAAPAERAGAAVRGARRDGPARARASASRSAPTTGPTSPRSCGGPTSRCTRPSASRATSASTTPRATRTHPPGCSASASCARALGRGRARPALPAEGRGRRTARSPASRRSCAGSTRATGCSRRPSSCRSPSGPG